jgi:hypothetical protein
MAGEGGSVPAVGSTALPASPGIPPPALPTVPPASTAQPSTMRGGGHGLAPFALLALLAAAALAAGRRLTFPGLTLRQTFHRPLVSPG